MKRIYYLFAVACLFAVTSCCTLRTISETQTKEPMTREIIADLDVRSEKITETYSVEVKNKLGVNEEELKDNAVFDALKKIGADILVAPQFRINTQICNRTTVYTIVVSGYPAYYTNFRQMPSADRIELRELKEGASYVIVKKSAENNDLGYDKDIIVVPVRGGGNQTLNLDDVTLERIILKGEGAKDDMSFNCMPMGGYNRTYLNGGNNSTQVAKSDKSWSAFKRNVERNVQAQTRTKKEITYTFKQCRQMEIAGMALTSIGVGFIIPSIALMGIGEEIGLYMMFPSIACLVPGVTLWSVGGVNKKKVKRNNVSLSLNGGNGVGLSLNF